MLESELVKQIEDYLNKYHIRYAREIRMGIGVPDITLNIGASKSIPTVSDYYLLLVVEYLSNKGNVSIKEILEYFQFDKSKLITYLNQLRLENIIAINNDNVILKRKIFGLNLGKTVSIEAKIKDWKNGILQAQRYLMFSDYSYLALPKSRIKNVDISDLNVGGIGLLAVDSDGSIEEIVSPQKSQECEYKQKYILTTTILSNNKNTIKRRGDEIFSKHED